jgi:hypothetical protein
MNVETIISQLRPYQNQKILIRRNQNVNDIIAAIKTAHNQYRSEYKKIALNFVGKTKKGTAKNIWNFIKKNVPYRAEPDHFQTIKSPAAIIATAKSGTMDNDCKNYSLFAGGILHALNDFGYNIPFCYRFASYNFFDATPGHVFIVVDPGTNNEIWIDPVLPTFDNKKQFNHKKDLNMMYSISGIGQTKRQKRQAKRAERKKAGKTFGQKLKKAGKGVLKVAGAPSRNAFLLLVKLNVFNLAKKLEIANTKAPGKLKNFWESIGGRMQTLINNINQGKGKKRIMGIGVIPAAAAAAPAAAAPIIAKIISLLKDLGINTDDLKRVAANAINGKVKDIIARQEGKEETAIAESENTATEALDEPESSTGTDMKKLLPLIAIAGAGIYLLTRKK